MFKPLRELNREERCPQCHSVMSRGVTAPGLHIWKPVTLEHINVEGEGPLTFETEGSLRAYCKKHGLESGALL